MDAFNNLVQNCKALWTDEEERYAISLLKNWDVEKGKRKERKDYYIYDNFAIKAFAGFEKLVSKNGNKVLATKETVFKTVKDVHTACGHKGDRKTHQKICEEYANITRKIVESFIRQCERCTEKLKKKEKKGLVVRPITVKDFNARGQVDLVDFQSLPDGDFKYTFHYQDHLSKYHFLRPLRSKTAVEVANHLFQIFIDFGAPQILQSDNGREFTALVIKVNNR